MTKSLSITGSSSFTGIPVCKNTLAVPGVYTVTITGYVSGSETSNRKLFFWFRSRSRKKYEKMIILNLVRR